MTDDWFFAESTRKHLLEQRQLAVAILMACGSKFRSTRIKMASVSSFLAH
jgi:hypothetical protein